MLGTKVCLQVFGNTTADVKKRSIKYFVPPDKVAYDLINNPH